MRTCPRANCNGGSDFTSGGTEKLAVSAQEQFADKLGYHRTYVGGLERGERNLTLKAVERIAGRLRLDPLELLRTPNR